MWESNITTWTQMCAACLLPARHNTRPETLMRHVVLECCVAERQHELFLCRFYVIIMIIIKRAVCSSL
jgi:hypothetical protein